MGELKEKAINERDNLLMRFMEEGEIYVMDLYELR